MLHSFVDVDFLWRACYFFGSLIYSRFVFSAYGKHLFVQFQCSSRKVGKLGDLGALCLRCCLHDFSCARGVFVEI